MRVLLLNQFFWPDAAATSQLLTDVAAGLKERGHDVHVICGSGGYSVKDESNNPGVKVYRVKTFPFGRGKLGRALSYATFFLTCAVKGLLLRRTDLVITLTTPPLLSLIGSLIKIFHGSSHFIWEMDLYPEVAVDLQLIRQDGLLDRTVGAFADWSRRKADGIIVLGECMRQRLIDRGIAEERLHIAHNWADGRLISPLPRSFAKPQLSVLYSGNLGLAHDVETIAEAMLNLKADKQIQFTFAGGGSLRRSFEAQCRQLDVAVEFRSYSLLSKLSQVLSSCDIGLITQRQECAGSVVPSKVYGLMAAGRPILFIGPAESTVANIVRDCRCGWQVDNGDSHRVVELLRFLMNEPARVQSAGQRARKAFEQNYDRPIGVERICSLVGASVALPQPEVCRAG